MTRRYQMQVHFIFGIVMVGILSNILLVIMLKIKMDFHLFMYLGASSGVLPMLVTTFVNNISYNKKAIIKEEKAKECKLLNKKIVFVSGAILGSIFVNCMFFIFANNKYVDLDSLEYVFMNIFIVSIIVILFLIVFKYIEKNYNLQFTKNVDEVAYKLWDKNTSLTYIPFITLIILLLFCGVFKNCNLSFIILFLESALIVEKLGIAIYYILYGLFFNEK